MDIFNHRQKYNSFIVMQVQKGVNTFSRAFFFLCNSDKVFAKKNQNAINVEALLRSWKFEDFIERFKCKLKFTIIFILMTFELFVFVQC